MKRVNVQPLLQLEPKTPAVQGDRRALEQVFTIDENEMTMSIGGDRVTLVRS